MTLRTIEQMDEKDWIIVRLYSLLLRINGFNITAIPEFRHVTRWMGNSLWLMTYEAGLDPNDPYAGIIEEQNKQLNEFDVSAFPAFSNIAAWPYAQPEDTLPLACLIIGRMENMENA
jgi:hypothetical protein